MIPVYLLVYLCFVIRQAISSNSHIWILVTLPPTISPYWPQRFLNHNTQFFKKNQKPLAIDRKNAHSVEDFIIYFEKYMKIRIQRDSRCRCLEHGWDGISHWTWDTTLGYYNGSGNITTPIRSTQQGVFDWIWKYQWWRGGDSAHVDSEWWGGGACGTRKTYRAGSTEARRHYYAWSQGEDCKTSWGWVWKGK